MIEVIAPAPNGLLLRRLVATPRPQDEELWEETTTLIRPTSQSRIEVEIRRTTERRNVAGSVAPKVVSPPVAFAVDH